MGNNSTLRNKNETSICGDEKGNEFGFDLNVSMEDFNNSLMSQRNNKNNDIKTSFNEYINKLNNNVNMNSIDIETNEKLC